jgi:hypothetical protein
VTLKKFVVGRLLKKKMPWKQHFVNRDFCSHEKVKLRILEVERTVDKFFWDNWEMKTLDRKNFGT